MERHEESVSNEKPAGGKPLTAKTLNPHFSFFSHFSLCSFFHLYFFHFSGSLCILSFSLCVFFPVFHLTLLENGCFVKRSRHSRETQVAAWIQEQERMKKKKDLKKAAGEQAIKVSFHCSRFLADFLVESMYVNVFGLYAEDAGW